MKIKYLLIFLSFFFSQFFNINILARPFGMQTMTHINNAIKQQVRRAFIPVLKSKKEKIEFPQIMAFSKDYLSFAFLTEGGYISAWDLKQGKEYFNFSVSTFKISQITINHTNKVLFILDKQGNAYKKEIFSQNPIEKYQPVMAKYSQIKTVRKTQVMVAEKQLIIAPNIPLKKPFSYSLENKIVDFDITSKANILVAVTAHQVFLFKLTGLNKLQQVKHWQLEQTIKQVIIDDKTGSIALRLESSFFSNAGYALISKKGKKIKDYKTIQLFNHQITDMAFTEQQQLGVYTQGKEIFYLNLNSAKIEKTLSIEKFNPELIQFYQTDNFVFIPVRDKGIHLINIKTGKKLAQLVSTKNGWAVLDSSGRYDGNEEAVNDISWEVNGQMLELDRFSKRYFEPGLLSHVVFNTKSQRAKSTKKVTRKMITEPKNILEEGVFLPPQVTLKIQSNKEKIKTSGKIKLLVTAKVEDKKNVLKELKFFHNGKRLANKKIILAKNSKSQEIKWTLQVTATKGKNNFVAEVGGWGDIFGKSKTNSVFVQAIGKENKTKHEPVVFIKSIGIDEYQGSELALNFAVADAKDIFNVISDYHDSLSKNKNKNKNKPYAIKTLLLNEQATKKQMLKLLDKVKNTASADDTLFVFMSGHGQVVDGKWYFLPQEAKTLSNPSHVKKVGLSASELSDKLVTIPNQKIVLIIDACQSGAATEDFNNFQQRRDLSGLSKDTGIHIMAATRADQLAPEYSQLGHGVFTYILLNGLKKNKKGFYNADLWPKDGKVMISELKKYTQKFVPIMISVLEKRREEKLANRGVANERTIVTPVGSSIGKDFQLF